MPRDGRKTKEKILEATQDLVLEKGFAGTSIDEILAATKLTKGTFFYHFSTKSDLAMALLQRFWNQDRGQMEALIERANTLGDEPLQRYLLFLKLFEEAFDAQQEGSIGCLFATYVYEVQQFEPQVNDYVRESLRDWQAMFEGVLNPVFAKHTPALEITVADLAGMLISVIEGAFVVAKSFNDTGYLARQIAQYRNYVKLLFGA